MPNGNILETGTGPEKQRSAVQGQYVKKRKSHYISTEIISHVPGRVQSSVVRVVSVAGVMNCSSLDVFNFASSSCAVFVL